MQNYYHILGVTPNATLDQIKKAYRRKAKIFHPDINKSPDANEQFILVNEAYEYLLNTTGNHTNRLKRTKEQAQKRANYQQQWEQQEKEKTRKRAQAYARMKYEAYIISDVYKATEALNIIADFLVTAVILLFVVALPILSYREHGSVAFIISAIIILPTSPIWFHFLVRTVSNINLQSYFTLKKATLKSKIITFIILTLFNIIIFFVVAMNTLIELKWIIAFYAVSIFIGYLISLFVKPKYIKHLIRIDLPLSFINLIFLTNALFASNPQTESYQFSLNYYNKNGLYSTIELENHAYQNYIGIRTFAIDDQLWAKSKITYVFKDGLFGFRVAKEIQLD